MVAVGAVTKYAMLITNWNHGTPRDVPVGPDARCAWWDVDDIGEEQSRDAWRESFGTFQWDYLRHDRACLLAFGNDVTDTTNAFNETLMVRTRLAAYAYLLNRPPLNSGGVFWMVSGITDTARRPESLRSFERLPELFNPYFIQRPTFAAQLAAFQANAWIDDWCADFALLDAARGGAWLISPPVEMAILSFYDASCSRYLDFRMPALVRTIESLIAIPRNQGQQMFSARSARFATNVQNHPHLAATGRTLAQVLGELYQLRSDAVHGKWPLRAMRDAGREDDVALLDYLAEGIARAAIKWAIRNRVTFSAYTTRQALEDAWSNGTIPP